MASNSINILRQRHQWRYDVLLTVVPHFRGAVLIRHFAVYNVSNEIILI